jgi:hypothetical protein
MAAGFDFDASMAVTALTALETASILLSIAFCVGMVRHMNAAEIGS